MAKNNKFNQWSLTVLRIVLGIIFIYHGYAKLFVPGGFKGTIDFFTAISIPLPLYSALLVSIVEFIGGIFLLVGIITKWTALVLFVEMLVAFFKVHLNQGFFITPQAYGYEFVLLILASLVVIFFNGAGRLSFGKRFFKNKQLH